MSDEMKTLLVKGRVIELVRTCAETMNIKLNPEQFEILVDNVCNNFDSMFTTMLDDFDLNMYKIDNIEMVKVDDLMPNLQGMALLYLVNETMLFYATIDRRNKN